MFCPECGAQLHANDPFCGECGAPQEPHPGTASSIIVKADKKKRPEAKMSEPNQIKSMPNVQLEPGTLLLDRYLIVRRVGGGGMGSVYQARDKRLADRLCAVKEMIEMFADEHQRTKAVDDFKREAEVLAQLEHPSIPTIYDYFIQNGRYYLVMKWIGGGDLAEQMRAHGGLVDEVDVCSWGIQICDVLRYIHSQIPPIIYRDLKPANLMLDDKSNRVMLVDFGIARIVRPTEKGVTAIGTMGYAPPELFAGKVEPRSDLYSLGATMFHMMTGSDPQDNPLLIFDFARNPRPAQLNPAITAEMEAILMKSVAHNPSERQASADDLARALEDHLARLKVLGRKPASTMGERPPSNDVRPRNAAPPIPPSSSQRAAPAGPKPAAPASRPGTTVPEHASEIVFCGHCGQKIAQDDVFCPHCGYRQPIVGVPPLSGTGAARITAQLVVVGTSDMVKPFAIDKDSVTIGRQDPHTGIFPEVDLTRYDPETKVSRKHARIYREGAHFFVEDLASVNGTVINSAGGGQVRLDPRSPRVLSTGDELKLGETTLKFMIV